MQMDFLQWIWYLLFTATLLGTTLGCWLTFWACGLRTRHKTVRLLFKCLPLPWQQEEFEGYRLLRGQRGCPWSQPARIEGPHRRRREIDGNPQELADVGLKCIQVWPITQFFLSTICKKIIKYPSSGRTSNSLISVSNPWKAFRDDKASIKDPQFATCVTCVTFGIKAMQGPVLCSALGVDVKEYRYKLWPCVSIQHML